VPSESTDPAVVERDALRRKLIDQHLVASTYTQQQFRVLEAIKTSRRVAVHSGHSTGKSFVAADIAIWFKTAFRGSKVITTAPTSRQVSKVLWGELRHRYHSSRLDLGGEMLPSEPLWKFDGNEFAIGFASKDYDPHAMSGFHARHLLVIIDEAAGVSSQVWDACTRLATGEMNTILAIGNPGDSTGPFHDACMENERWKTVHLDSTQHPNVETGVEIIPGAATRAWVDDKLVEYGSEDDPRFQAFVRGYFPDAGSSTVIRPSWVRAAEEREPTDRGPITIGVDVAGFGTDESVIAVFRGASHIKTIASSTLQPVELQAQIINVGLSYTGEDLEICIDADGMGQPVWDAIRKHPTAIDRGWNVVPFQGGLKPDFQPGKKYDARWEQYFNHRAMAWFLLSDALRDGHVSMRPDPSKRTQKQLTSLTYGFAPSGLLKLERKEDLAKRIPDLGSPDRADALAMAFWCYATRGAARRRPDQKRRRRTPGDWRHEFDELVAG